MVELEHLIDLLIGVKTIKSTCFMCFKQDNDMLDIYENNLHVEGLNKTLTFSLASLMKEVFPMQDIILSKACHNCVEMLLNIYTSLRRKNYIEQCLSYIIKKITGKLKTTSLQENLFIEVNVLHKDEQTILKKTTPATENSKAMDVTKNVDYTLNSTHNVEVCHICFKSFNIEYLKQHLRQHKYRKERKSYSCDICNYITKCKTTLEGHINSKHLYHRPYVCACSKRFYTKSALTEHNKTHTHIKDVICEICGDRFHYKKSLINHLKLHSDTKMFECLVCNQRFVNKSRVNDHMKRKHGEKREICFLCGKKFVLKKELKRHMKLVHKDSSLDNVFDFHGMLGETLPD